MESAERHCCMSDVKSAQCNQPLHSPNNRLEFLHPVRSKFHKIVKFGLVFLVHRCMDFCRRSAKHHVEVITHMFHAGLCSAAECAILVMKEITTKVTARLFNTLQITVSWDQLQFLAKFVRIQQSHECNIHMHKHMFTTSSTIMCPNIWISTKQE